MNTYSSLNPSEMTNAEIRNICGDFFTAKNGNQKEVIVYLKLDNSDHGKVKVNLPLERYQTYLNAHKTETGAINFSKRT